MCATQSGPPESGACGDTRGYGGDWGNTAPRYCLSGYRHDKGREGLALALLGKWTQRRRIGVWTQRRRSVTV